jgi:dUTP pyrophosphatase
MIETIKYKKLSQNATAPESSSEDDAGYDLFAAHDGCMSGGGRGIIKTNISIELPEGYYGQLEGRSGLAVKSGIAVLGGIIDPNYRGDIGVILVNLDNEKTFVYKKGDKICQMVIKPYIKPQMIEADELSATDRGEKGFGSSGERAKNG